MENKLSYIYKILFCFINSLIGIFTIHFHYAIDGFGNNNEVYLDNLSVKDLLYFFIFFGIWYIILSFIKKLINKKYQKKLFIISNKRLFIISILIFLLCWSFYLLSFFPGGIYSDTFNNIKQAMGIDSFGNGYPFFYTMYIKLIYLISFKNIKIMQIIMCLIQIILFIISLSYFIIWLNNKKIDKRFIIFSLLFFAINPIFPIYSLSLWKDSLFAIFLFLFILKAIDLLFNYNKNNIVLFIIFLILTSLFRNNGIYLIIIFIFCYFIFYKKYFNFKFKKYISILIIVLFLIEVPLLNILGINVPFKESVGIKINQIAYVVTNNGNIDKESKEFINNLYPIDEYKNKFLPMLVDEIKKSSKFNDQFLENNKLKFYKTYYKLMLKNKTMYFKEHLFITSGYWNYYLINYGMGCESLENFYKGIYYSKNYYEFNNNIDFFKKIFGFSIKNNLKIVALYLNNSAIPFLILNICIYIIFLKKKYKNLIFYFPSFLIYICLFLGTPIAFSSRYVIYLYLSLTLMLIMPFLNIRLKYKK